MALLYNIRGRLAAVKDPLALPGLCLLFSGVFVVVAVTLVMIYSRPGVPLVTPFGSSWFSIGWSQSLNFMGVLIDSPVAYGLIINYQITRCILGSLLSNAFQPYVNALQSKLINREIKNPYRLLAARVFTDIYSFVSGLTDLILYVSQIDIFVLSGLSTILTNLASTYVLLVSVEQVANDHKEKDIADVSDGLERSLDVKTHPEALLFGGARMRL